MRKVFTVLLTLALATSSLSAAQAPAGQTRKKDTYEVYSLAIRATNVPAESAIYLIEEKTGTRVGPLTTTGIPCNVPASHQRNWTEAVTDVIVRGTAAITLDRSFNLPQKPYLLLAEADVSAFSATLLVPVTGPPPKPDPKFRKAKASYSLSDVFFNKNRTFALVFVTTFCGSRCGRGEWKAFERPVGGDWREAPLRCVSSWIA